MLRFVSSLPSFSARRIAWLGSFYFGILLILSAVFFKERCTYMDVSFQTFEMIRTGWPATQVYRFGSVMTQIFPLLAIWLKAPLWLVGLSYSIGVVMYQAILFGYIAWYRRSEKWALVFLLAQSMLTAHMFFWIQSEFSQSIPWMIFLLCRMEETTWTGKSRLTFLPDALFLITMVFFHPLSFPVYMLCVILLLMAMPSWKTGIPLMVSVVWSALVYGVKRLWFDNWYDHGAHERTDNLFALFPNYFSTDSTLQFLRQSNWLYVGVWISLVLLCGILMYRGQWVKAVLSISIPATYFFFINVTHPSAEVFYLENFYLGIPLLLSVMLVYWSDFSTNVTVPRTHWYLSLLLSVLACLRFAQLDRDYAARLDGYRNLVTEYAGRKVILEERQLDMKQVIMSWPSAYEIWMLTQMEKGSTASLLITDDADKYRNYLSDSRAFFGLQIYSYDSLPSRYFHFTDSVSRYQILP